MSMPFYHIQAIEIYKKKEEEEEIHGINERRNSLEFEDNQKMTRLTRNISRKINNNAKKKRVDSYPKKNY